MGDALAAVSARAIQHKRQERRNRKKQSRRQQQRQQQQGNNAKNEDDDDDDDDEDDDDDGHAHNSGGGGGDGEENKRGGAAGEAAAGAKRGKTPAEAAAADLPHVWSAWEICEAYAIKRGFYTTKGARDCTRAAQVRMRLVAGARGVFVCCCCVDGGRRGESAGHSFTHFSSRFLFPIRRRFCTMLWTVVWCSTQCRLTRN